MLRRINKLHFCIAIFVLLTIWLVVSKDSAIRNFYSDVKIFLDRVSSASDLFNTCDDHGKCASDDDSESNLHDLRQSVNTLPLDWSIETLLPPPLEMTIERGQSVRLDWKSDIENESDAVLANNLIFDPTRSNSALTLNIKIELNDTSSELTCKSGDTFQLATSLSLNPEIIFTCGGQTTDAGRCILKFENLSADLTSYSQCQAK